MRRDRSAERTDSTGAPAAGHNNSRSVNGYDAYFGRYTVNEEAGVVTQTLDGAPAGEERRRRTPRRSS